MNFAQKDVISSHNSINHFKESVNEASFKKCLLTSVWTQSRLVASLLDQVGLAYHRVFDNDALELFLVLINTEISTCNSLVNFNVSALTALNTNLLTIQTNLISSMDLFVVEALNNTQKQTKKVNVFQRMFGKHNAWKLCAKSRFEQIICPVLEQKLINKNHN